MLPKVQNFFSDYEGFKIDLSDQNPLTNHNKLIYTKRNPNHIYKEIKHIHFSRHVFFIALVAPIR